MTGRKTLGILGKKLGMTQLFRDDGSCVPVTVVQAGPCKVTQVKNVLAGEHHEDHRKAHNNKGKKSGRTERARAADGYYAVQLGFEDKPVRTTSKAELGHVKAAGLDNAMRFTKEFRLEESPTVAPGDTVSVDIDLPPPAPRSRRPPLGAPRAVPSLSSGSILGNNLVGPASSFIRSS